jgi:hypothetical protein
MRVATQRPRTETPGTAMHVLVLSPSPTRTIGVDLASGAFVRMDHPAPQGDRAKLAPRWRDVAIGRVGEGMHADLPTPREAVALQHPLRTVGKMSTRKTDRILRPLQHNPGRALLGCEGPAIPIWALGTTPAVTIVEPDGGLYLDVGATGVWAMFGWKGYTHRVRVEDRRVMARLDWFPPTPVSASGLGTTLGFIPRRMLMTYTDPIQGYCYKTVTALLP